jgi:hypothetical protein
VLSGVARGARCRCGKRVRESADARQSAFGVVRLDATHPYTADTSGEPPFQGGGGTSDIVSSHTLWARTSLAGPGVGGCSLVEGFWEPQVRGSAVAPDQTGVREMPCRFERRRAALAPMRGVRSTWAQPYRYSGRKRNPAEKMNDSTSRRRRAGRREIAPAVDVTCAVRRGRGVRSGRPDTERSRVMAFPTRSPIGQGAAGD